MSLKFLSNVARGVGSGGDKPLPYIWADRRRLACIGVAVLIALLIEWSGFGERVDLQVSSLLFQNLGTRFKPSPEIVLLVIDDASLQILEPKVGRWPWPRSLLARLVQSCKPFRQAQDLSRAESRGKPLRPIRQGLRMANEVEPQAQDLPAEADLSRAASTDSTSSPPRPERSRGVGSGLVPSGVEGRAESRGKGARSVGIDILFFERDRFHPDNDAQLAEALRQNGHCVLAGAFVDELTRTTPASSIFLQRSLISTSHQQGRRPEERFLQQFLVPISVIGEAASRVGHTNFFPARDQILRSYPYFIATDQGLVPSLAVAVWMTDPGAPPAMVRNPDLLDGVSESQELVFYSQPFPRYSAIDVLGLTGRHMEPQWADGKIILIGVEAQGLHDLRATPLAGNRSGLDIHATALSNWMQRTWLHGLGRPAVCLLAGLFGMLPIFGWNDSTRRTWTRWGLFIGGYHALGAVAFYIVPFRLPWMTPMAAFLVAMTWRLGLSFIAERTLKKQFEEMQKMKEMLTGMLLHDLNAPLSSMILLVRSVRDEVPDGSKARNRMGDALAEGSRLSELLRTLLDIQRMEAGRMKLSASSFAWEKLVEETVLRLEPRARQLGLGIDTTKARVPVEIQGDRLMLARVLMNFLDNALKYATPGSAIICKTLMQQPRGGWLTFQVINHGAAIDIRDQQQIFEWFVQGERSSSDVGFPGFGLGLAFCKLAILAHGGNVKCVSPVPNWNGGASFEFSIPIHSSLKKQIAQTTP